MSEQKHNRDVDHSILLANMIEVGTEVITKISPDFIEMGNTNESKEAVGEALGSVILSNILKEAGV